MRWLLARIRAPARLKLSPRCANTAFFTESELVLLTTTVQNCRVFGAEYATPKSRTDSVVNRSFQCVSAIVLTAASAVAGMSAWAAGQKGEKGEVVYKWVDERGVV